MSTTLPEAPPQPSSGNVRTHRRLAAARRWTTRVLAAFGLAGLIGLGVGVVADVSDFDNTSGGYDPPFEGWTGTPTNWSAQDVTPTGFRKPGYVLDTTFDCTSGMIAVDMFGASINFRVVSERGIVVHKPREACIEAGFTPKF